MNFFEQYIAEYFICRAQPEEILELSQIEYESYPPDESASYERMMMRQEVASDYFWTFSYNNNIIGFINGTCSSHDEIHHESMASHDTTGHNLVIHSVVTKSSFRHKGFGSFMLKSYINKIKNLGFIKKIMLLAKGNLLGFYSSCGFRVIGISSVSHGKVLYMYAIYERLVKKGFKYTIL